MEETIVNTHKDKFEIEFEERIARFEEQQQRVALEKLKKLDEEYPLRDRILALEEAKAKENIVKNISDLENIYGSEIDSPSLTFSLTELLKKEFPPVTWLVEKLIPLGGLVAFSGLPGSFKSWITQHLALSVATGTPLFGKFSTIQKRVLIVDKENQFSLVQKRFKLLGGFEGIDVCFLQPEFFIEDDTLISKICNLIQIEKIGLIIFDSLIRIYKGKDENSSNDMSEVFRQLKRFQDVGATVIFIHHHRKQGIFSKNISAEAMRGSSDILASVDSHLAIDTLEDYIRVSQPKLRQDVPIKPFKIRLESDKNKAEFVFYGEIEDEKEKIEKAKEEIEQVLEEGEVSRSELIDRFKGVFGSKTIDSALKSFSTEDIKIRVAERGKKYYSKGEGLFNPA